MTNMITNTNVNATSPNASLPILPTLAKRSFDVPGRTPAVNKDIQRVPYADLKRSYDDKHTQLTKATQEFEAVFIGLLLKQMRKSMAGQNAMFGNSQEAKLYQDMADDASAQQMSKVGTFGLSKVMFESMKHVLPVDPDETLRQSLLAVSKSL